MRRRLRGLLVAASIGLLLSTAAGCYGHFKLVNGVREFNEGVGENRVMRSLVMWALVIIPVYEVAWLGDVLVFNVIEFFNAPPSPVTTEKRHALPGGGEVRVARVSPDVVRIRRTDGAGHEQEVELVRVGDHAGYLRRLARDGGGIIGIVEELPDGRLVAASP
ncbi:MAG TPA: DUF3332 family protein [Polyangia bacterium]|nr:DUF3332 family protein [Polyangia bacterium]